MANRISKLANMYVQETHSEDIPGELKAMIVRAYKAGYKECMKDNPKIKEPKYNPPTKTLVDDMKALYGIPPHDHGSNTSMGDSYFSNDLKQRIERAGCSWNEVLEQARTEGRNTPASWDK